MPPFIRAHCTVNGRRKAWSTRTLANEDPGRHTSTCISSRIGVRLLSRIVSRVVAVSIHGDNLPDRATFERLLGQARGGVSPALGELLESYRKYLLWLADHELAADLRAKAGASDLVQETFVRAQQGFDRFRGHSPHEFKGWLRKILLHNLANLHRDYLATEKRDVSKETPLETGGAFEDQIVTFADADPSPSSVLRHDEESDRLKSAIDALPDDYRLVIQLRYWRRLTFGEIGQQMNRSTESARKLWARAFARLEKELERPEDDLN